MKNKILSSFLLICSLFSSFSFSMGLVDLYNEDRLRIETKIEKKENIAVGEQVILKIIVSTDRWFAAGTRIDAPRIKNAVSLKQNKLSTNMTFKENGKTWSAQIWEITIYPQKTGEFYIPSIPVEITISESFNNKINGVVLTEPLSFNTILPNGFITEDISWLSASEFKLTENIKKPKTDLLKVGDAIVRNINFKAKNTVSMLFPKINNQEVDGVKTYLSQNINKDQSTRGDYVATREQKITYIIQENGKIEIPEIVIYWWDIDNKEWKKEILPSIEILSKHTPMSWLKSHIIEISISLISLVLFFLCRRKIYKVIKYIVMKDSIQFIRYLFFKDIKNLNKLNYKKLKKVNDLILLRNNESIDKKVLLKWDNHYSKESNKISRLTLLRIRKNIK